MPQTYQCDICNTVAGDFMVTYINDGRTVSVGVECLPLWALPIAAGWAEALIDQGAEVPEWAPLVIDAARQLTELVTGGPVEAVEPPEGGEAITGPPPDPDAPTGRPEAGDGPQDTVGENSEAGQASHVDR